MVSDVRPMLRQRRSLELRARSRSPTCTFREDVQGVAKKLLESRSNDQSVDTPPDPNVSIPFHLLIAETLCGWSLPSPASETRQSSVLTKKSNCSSYQNGEDTSTNADTDLLGAEANCGFRKKRKYLSNGSFEKLSNHRRIFRQTLPFTEFSWKACIDEQSYSYRPDNREYIQWKVSTRLQLQERMEKQSADSKMGYRKSASDGCSSSKLEAANPPTEQVVEVETRQVENFPEVLIFNYGSSEDPRMRLEDSLAARTVKDDMKETNGRSLMIGELRVGTRKRHGGLADERTSFPSIISRPRFSHPSFSSLHRRLELQKLSVEGIQVPEMQRRCHCSGEEAGDGKQNSDWFVEEEEDEEEDMRNSESEEEDVFELNDLSAHDSSVDLDRNASKNKMEFRSVEEEEVKSTQLGCELEQTPSAESHEVYDTNCSISRKPNEKHRLSRVSPVRLRFQNLDADVEDQTREELTGVLTISGIFPPIGIENSSRSSSEDTSGSEFQTANKLEAKRSEGTCEDLCSASTEPSFPIELRLPTEALCLDFRRHPS